MNQIINEICNILNITEKQVNATLKLLQEGNTIPFIARYRKEALCTTLSLMTRYKQRS